MATISSYARRPSHGVFAVQCPNPRCRKYMLVEEHDRGNVVPCLLCKTAIRVGGAPPPQTGDAPGRNGGGADGLTVAHFAGAACRASAAFTSRARSARRLFSSWMFLARFFIGLDVGPQVFQFLLHADGVGLGRLEKPAQPRLSR